MTFIQLAGGGICDLSGPYPVLSGVTIEGIAHALARINRYTGNGDQVYTVAQHSLMVARAVRAVESNPHAARSALLHDASEVVTSDIPGPLKGMIGGDLRKLEYSVHGQISLQFDAHPYYMRGTIKQIDRAMLIHEVPHVFDTPRPEWAPILDAIRAETPPDILSACADVFRDVMTAGPDTDANNFLVFWESLL